MLSYECSASFCVSPTATATDRKPGPRAPISSALIATVNNRGGGDTRIWKSQGGDMRPRTFLPPLPPPPASPRELIRPFISNGLPNARAISQPFWGWKRHAHSTARPARFIRLVGGGWNTGVRTRDPGVAIGRETPQSVLPALAIR